MGPSFKSGVFTGKKKIRRTSQLSRSGFNNNTFCIKTEPLGIDYKTTSKKEMLIMPCEVHIVQLVTSFPPHHSLEAHALQGICICIFTAERVKTNLKVIVSITQSSGIQSVYLEEKQNIIILPFISQKTCIFNKCYPSGLLGTSLCKLALDHMPMKPNKSFR